LCPLWFNSLSFSIHDSVNAILEERDVEVYQKARAQT
jgi:hypothetical protein